MSHKEKAPVALERDRSCETYQPIARANTMKNIQNSRRARKRLIAPLPLFEFVRERDFRAMPQPARWVARRFRLSPTIAAIVAEQALLGGRE